MDSRDAVRRVIRQRPKDLEGALIALVRSYDRIDVSKHRTLEFYDKYSDSAPCGPVEKAVQGIVERNDRVDDYVLPVALLIEDRIFSRRMKAYGQYINPHTE